ncbi:MAG: helix-turn-helix domain-containing protein [Oscillospiraceae bacterium]|nr:helix-turn-helix domain-containing protein [Oscillospiraceae bacterium]
MSQLFSRNLKRLRTEKSYTQEQAAQALGVTPQTVSRWECGTTMPDVMLLPEIARLYCVTVDDLFHENKSAYENFAQRLGSVYEASREPADFARAEAEFRKLLDGGDYTAEDLRLYGIIHQYMTAHCIRAGLDAFDRVLEMGPENDEDAYWRTLRQKLYFLSMLGRGRESVDEQRKRVERSPEDANEWICMIAACTYAGETEAAFDWFCRAREKFPDQAAIYVYGGDICKRMGRIPEAFENWDHALSLDENFCDAKCAKAFCFESMGEWEKAYDVWRDVAQQERGEGRVIEMQIQLKRADECARRMKESRQGND